MTRSALAYLYEGIRYEDGRWPLWRWDKNLRYIAKSLLHRAAPWTARDRDHFERVFAQLATRQRPTPTRDTLRMVAGGDLMWIRSGWRDAMSPALVQKIRGADVALVNLETPMAPGRPVPEMVYETLHYNAPEEYLDAWRGDRPAVISLCNNHALDQGDVGLRDTRDAVTRLGLHPVGGPLGEHTIAAIEAKGARIGVTGLTYGINHARAFPEGIPVERLGSASHEPDWARLARAIDAAREAGPDLVVLMPHWGFEYEYWPAERQRAHAARLIEMGADVILGSSPHVLQPVELVSIDGADARCPTQVTRASSSRGAGARTGLIAWSLGNLATVMPTLPCKVGALLTIDLERGPNGLSVTNASATPTWSGQRHGARWLDVETLTLDELEARGHDVDVHRRHARAMLGAALEEEVQRE